MKANKTALYWSVLASAILLSACGGGGSSSSDTDVVAPAAAAGGAIDGVTAKGFLKKAIISVYCGNSEAAADLLKAGVTGSVGEYALTWTGACSKPLKLVVTVDANTTMADEATGKDVTPPVGFKLRALVADPSITATKNITPFTDMAVAIAGTSATLSKAAISNAETAIISSVLGGDLDAYQAAPRASTVAGLANASAAEKKLATLLTVLSAFAQDDATCKAKTTDGDRIKCATDSFAAQAVATFTAVSDTGYTVATTVPTNTPASMLAATLDKIKKKTITGMTATDLSTEITSDTSGATTLLAAATAAVTKAAASTGGIVVVASASGVQAARDLFNSLKNDLSSISNGNSSGYLDKKLSDMKTDWSTNGLGSAAGFVDFMTALNRATALANEAKTATWSVTGTLQANSAYLVPSSNMILETDSTGAAKAYVRSFPANNAPVLGIACSGTPGSAAACATAITNLMKSQALQNAMTCRVLVSEKTSGKAGCYYSAGKANVSLTTTSFTGYYHAVEVAESATTSGSYTWQDYTASREYTTTLFATPSGYSVPLMGNAVYVPGTAAPVAGTALTGTAVLTKTGADITAFAIKGDIQPLSTAADKSTLDISAALTKTTTTETMTVTGNVSNVKGTTTTATMALTTGSQIVGALATATTNEHATSAILITLLKTTAFQFDGTLAIDSFVLEKGGGGNYQPTNASFTGKISTLSNGTATEFVSGTLGIKVANMADFNPSLPISATNFLKETASFTGTVTNGATAYALTFTADRSTYGQESATLNYTRAGSQIINVTATQVDATKVTTVTVKGSGDVSAVITSGSGDVKTGTTTVGSIAKGQLNFTDGTYLLLGI